jgi:hypothetical protein
MPDSWYKEQERIRAGQQKLLNKAAQFKAMELEKEQYIKSPLKLQSRSGIEAQQDEWEYEKNKNENIKRFK